MNLLDIYDLAWALARSSRSAKEMFLCRINNLGGVSDSYGAIENQGAWRAIAHPVGYAPPVTAIDTAQQYTFHPLAGRMWWRGRPTPRR